MRRIAVVAKFVIAMFGIALYTLQALAASPRAIDSLSAIIDLRQKLDKLYTAAPYRSGLVSVKVISLRTGETLYERNADKPLTPASTTKLFSTATLYTLRGAGAELVTDVRIDGTIDASGVLRGDLYLVGCGDALLSVSDIDGLADNLQRMGIKRITGTIYGDGHLFDSNVNRARYSGDNEDVEPLGPITALTLQRGGLSIVVSASRNGSVIINPLPASDGLEIVNTVQVSSARTRSGVRTQPSRKKGPSRAQRTARTARKRGRADLLPLYDSLSLGLGDAPRIRRRSGSRRVTRSVARVAASSSLLPNGTQRIVVSGRISPGTSTTVYTTLLRPAAATAGVLRQRLRTRGITVDGGVGERQHPATSSSVTSVRRPLVELASIVNKKSDNFLAEHVFKMCGAAGGARPSSAGASTQCVARALDSLGVPRLGCVFNDGSGLSRRNLTSASTQVALLQRIAAQPWAQEYKSTLAVAGNDGTIRKRLVGTYAANNVNAKTGTLRNVSALSGYVTTRDGEPLAFAFISNGNSVSSYKYTEDMAALFLASFSRAVPSTLQQSTVNEVTRP